MIKPRKKMLLLTQRLVEKSRGLAGESVEAEVELEEMGPSLSQALMQLQPLEGAEEEEAEEAPEEAAQEEAELP